MLGALASAADLANGFPLGKVLRTSILAATLARHAGLGDAITREAYFLSQLRYLGCTGFSHEEAHTYGAGNDVALRNTMSMADAADKLGTVRAIWRGLAPGASLLAKGRAVARLLGDGDAVHDHASAQCGAALALGRIGGMPEELVQRLATICERWDGLGEPHHLAGEAIPLAMRVHQLADVVEIAHHRGGLAGARELVERRRGGQLDPTLSATFLAHAADCDRALRTTTLWEDFVAAEPGPALAATPDQVDGIARAIGHFADLKSVHLLGHSQRVAALAEATADALGLGAEAGRALRRAGHLHDIGRVAIQTGIWDRPGPLGRLEWSEVRLHTHHTERILSLSPAWDEVRAFACAAHEVPVGTGYHRGLVEAQLGTPARVLAACDTITAMGEDRPHRPALPRDRLVAAVRDEVRAGRHDRQVVEAALHAAGLEAPPPVERRSQAGLSEREVEVLCWVARGKTNKEIAAILSLSPKTVQHHVAHVYDKIGVYSRAGAAIFAMEQGLLAPTARPA
ncbi:MAG: HD domain-containing protein [Deltaproteobacteria bacterium]|nr:HD domain-containing protein [Deltaproteobacteria bacterium]